MKFLDHFSLPFSGMKNGLHHQSFEISSDFFHEFDDQPVKNGEISVDLNIDKRSMHTIIDFEISGKVETQCDRCLADIHLPIYGKYTLHFKIGEGDEDDEVVFLSDDVVSLNVSGYIYEFICLSIPVVKVYNCQDESVPPCDWEVLNKISGNTRESSNSDRESGIPGLKDLLK